MKVIYTRTMRVKDDGLGKAMEIGQGLAKVRGVQCDSEFAEAFEVIRLIID